MRFKKMVGAILLLTILCISFPGAALAATTPVVEFDETNLTSGIIGVSYNQQTELKLKVKIVKVDTQEKRYYDLEPGRMERFPLPLGDGAYQISVLKQYDASSYIRTASKDVTLELSDERNLYLASIQNIEWNQEMASIQLAQTLTAEATTDREKLQIIYGYITKNFSYDYDKAANMKSWYRTDVDLTLADKKGVCYDYSALMAAMLRSVGVPTKLVKGYTTRMAGYHAWNQVYLEGSGWVNVDSTVDAFYKAHNMSYQMIKAQNEYVMQSEM